KSAENPHYLHWTFNEESQEVECIGPGIMGKRYPGKLAALKDGEGPKFEKGLYGQGIYFNGKDAFIETEFKGIGGNRPRTVVFWVKVPKDFSTRNGYGIVSWGALEEGAAWQISPNPTKKDGLIGRLRAGTHKGMVIGTTDLRDDEWHHVAIVMYGGEDAEVSTHILIYIDGQLEKTSKKSVAKIRTNLTGKKSKSLMIGRNLGFSGGRHPNKFFKGSLDELFIFDTALSEEQIRSLMNTNSLPLKGEL
ncbi:MAG: LamG domain-containing protein, partial [Lentisphaerales bacterium]|nr:LamG domain-containing protein [Lentisphaerales bacterium]